MSQSYLEHQNEKQQALQQRELEWLADKIKMFTEEEQKAILASACAFAERGLIITPSIAISSKIQVVSKILCTLFVLLFSTWVRSIVIL